MVYPHNYGFIPRTLCEDNDPLDVLILMQVICYCLIFINSVEKPCLSILLSGDEHNAKVTRFLDNSHIIISLQLPEYTKY